MLERYRHEGAELRAVLPRLDALVDWERRDRTAAMRVSMAPMRDLLQRLGEPQRRRPLVHVTGTKGKGSTLAFVEAGLEREGVRTALLTSPHVESVTERLRVAREPIAAAPFAAAIERTLAARAAAATAGTPGGDSTWFDVVTAASAAAADAERADVWLVEVGLGGRLDSTNAFETHASGIVSIELEHTAVLGDTRPAIAVEKAGIARAGRALVVGLEPHDPAAVAIAEVAKARGANVVWCPPHGDIDARNRRLAARLLHELATTQPTDAAHVDWPRVQSAAARASAAVASGAVATPRLPGRFETWRTTDALTVVLDGAHVPESIALVLDQLRAHGLRGPFEVVFSCRRDKRSTEMLALLRPQTAQLVLTAIDDEHAPFVGELEAGARRCGHDVHVVSEPVAAFESALARARPSRRSVLVTGSLHLLGPVRRHLRSSGASQPT